MSLGFSKIILAIEAELSAEYLPGAIAWTDKHHHGAWSAAMDRFDKALSIAAERKDYRLAELEGGYYKSTVLDLLSKFKRAKGMEDATTFVESISRKPKP